MNISCIFAAEINSTLFDLLNEIFIIGAASPPLFGMFTDVIVVVNLLHRLANLVP